MICPKCSAWIPDDSRRCLSCGEILRKRIVPDEETEAKPKVKKENDKKTTAEISFSEADERRNVEEQSSSQKKQATKEAGSKSEISKDVSDSAEKSKSIVYSSSLWEKCTKIYLICIIISLGTWIFNIVRFGYQIELLTLVSMLAWLVPYIAMKKRSPKLMFGALAVRSVISIVSINASFGWYDEIGDLIIMLFRNYNYDLYNLNYVLCGAVLLFCSFKLWDRPFMRYRKAYSLILILPMALATLSWTGNMQYLFSSFTDMVWGISNVAEFLAVCALAYWIADYSPVGAGYYSSKNNRKYGK